MTQKIKETSKLLAFLTQSQSRHGIHSPYLFQLVDEVVRNKKGAASCKPAELLRQEYLLSKEIIRKTDFGRCAGDDHQPATYPVSLRNIARSSLTSLRHSRRLSRLASFLGATAILEIGTSLGVTAACLAMTQPEARIVTLEGCPELSRLARENFYRMGIRNVEVLTGPFASTITPALEKLGRVDLVYMDGNHCKEATIEYFQKCLGFITNDTVIVIDDIRRSSAMEEAWNMIIQNNEVRISLDLFFSGWIFFRRESSREHFRLRYI